MATTTIRLPDSLHKTIRHQALEKNISMNAWILRALETAANREGKTMNFDIRINNLFFEEIEGSDIEDALAGAGMDVDFTEIDKNSGYLHYDKSDIIAIVAGKIGKPDYEKDLDEVWEEINTAETLEITFGPAE